MKRWFAAMTALVVAAGMACLLLGGWLMKDRDEQPVEVTLLAGELSDFSPISVEMILTDSANGRHWWEQSLAFQENSFQLNSRMVSSTGVVDDVLPDAPPESRMELDYEKFDEAMPFCTFPSGTYRVKDYLDQYDYTLSLFAQDKTVWTSFPWFTVAPTEGDVVEVESYQNGSSTSSSFSGYSFETSLSVLSLSDGLYFTLPTVSFVGQRDWLPEGGQGDLISYEGYSGIFYVDPAHLDAETGEAVVEPLLMLPIGDNLTRQVFELLWVEELGQLALLAGENNELVVYLYDPATRTETARLSLGHCQRRNIELDEESAISVMWPPVAAVQDNKLIILQHDIYQEDGNFWLAQVWELTENGASSLIEAGVVLDQYAEVAPEHIRLVGDRLYLLATAGWQMQKFDLCCLEDSGLTAMARFSSAGGQEDQDSRMLWNYQVPEELTRRLKLYDHETTGDYRVWRQLELKVTAP